jgi:hypothetical protein
MLSSNRNWLSPSLAALLLAPLWGCGATGSGTTHATLIPVKGKVTYKGQPVTKGTVKFEPDDVGRPAVGKLQSDGTFVLGTYQEGDGVIAGHHLVSISGTGSRRGKEVIPKKYTQRSTSKLTADVDAEHTEFPFELNDGR